MDNKLTNEELLETKDKENNNVSEELVEGDTNDQLHSSVPEVEEALEETKENDELMRPLVDEIVKSLIEKIDDPDCFLDSNSSFSVLAKSITYLSQMYCDSHDHFNDELRIVNDLVTTNVMASLGAYADDDQVFNKVVYNDEVDLENFTLRRLMMLSASIIEYTLWRLKLNKKIEEKVQKEIQEKENNSSVTTSTQNE